MMPRPDELANQAEIERDQNLRRNVKKGASIVAGAAIAPYASKILPLLNEFVPANFAINAINKISPKLGKFLKKGEAMGLDPKEGLNYIKENFIQEEEKNDLPLIDFIESEALSGSDWITTVDKIRKKAKKGNKEYNNIIQEADEGKFKGYKNFNELVRSAFKDLQSKEKNQAAPSAQMQEQPYQQQPQQMSPGIQNLTNALNAVLQSGVLK